MRSNIHPIIVDIELIPIISLLFSNKCPISVRRDFFEHQGKKPCLQIKLAARLCLKITNRMSTRVGDLFGDLFLRFYLFLSNSICIISSGSRSTGISVMGINLAWEEKTQRSSSLIKDVMKRA